MITEFFFQHSVLFYRLTLFAVLSRELFHYITTYGLPFLQELIIKESKEQELLLTTRNNLRKARLRAEKDLMSQSATIALAEQSIENWYSKIIPERERQQQKLILFNQQIKELRTQRAAHAQKLTLKKTLLKEALTQSFVELVQEQQLNKTQKLDNLINNLSHNQFE